MNHNKSVFILSLLLTLLQGQDDSTRAVEWGYLDSLAGVYYFDDIPYTGPVVKQLDIGLMAGEFKDGIKHGKGTFTLANGDKYEGGWKDNVMHGKGTYTYANGDKYAMEGKLIREVDKDE